MVYKFEKIYNEQSGQLQREDGARFDWARYLFLKEKFDLNISIFEGSLYQASYRATITGNTTLFFYQAFEPGILFRGLTYDQIFESRLLELEVRVGSTPGALLETIPGYNLDRRMFASGDSRWTSNSPILRTDSITGGTVIDKWFEDTGGLGNSKSTSRYKQTNIGLYDSTTPRFYSIENTTGQDAEIAISWVWKEVIPF